MTDQVEVSQTSVGMGKTMARRIEYGIIALCLIAMALIFQPFVKMGFTIGCVLVVVGGLAFNLVPLCQPNRSLRSLGKAGIIVLLVFGVVVLLALGAAMLYGVYLTA